MAGVGEYMTKQTTGDFAREPSLVDKHLKLAVEGVRRIFAKISVLPDGDFSREQRRLATLMANKPANPVTLLVQQIYDAEAGRRGMPAAMARNDVDQAFLPSLLAKPRRH